MQFLSRRILYALIVKWSLLDGGTLAVCEVLFQILRCYAWAILEE